MIERVTAGEQRELERRERLYRDDRPPPDVKGRTVILIDERIGNRINLRAAVEALRQEGAKENVVAVAVAPPKRARR